MVLHCRSDKIWSRVECHWRKCDNGHLVFNDTRLYREYIN